MVWAFEINYIYFIGEFKSVAGGGNNNHLHLIVDNFYWGQAVRSEHYGWQFSSNTLDDPGFKKEVEGYLKSIS